MYVEWLGQPACNDTAAVGGKAACLSRLMTDYSIPPGFCLNTAAFDLWQTYAKNSESTTEGGRLPGELLDTLAAAYGELSRSNGAAALSVAVRSSGVHEDNTKYSFAGQYDTFLNVAGVGAIAKAISQCWGSKTNKRVLEYCRRNNLSAGGLRMAVLIQRMVPADISAVAFSLNPVSGCPEQVVINAGWGLGESILSGRVNPDMYVIHKADLAVTTRNIEEKHTMTVPAESGTREISVPRFFQKQAVISDRQVLEIAELTISLEGRMGYPVDIECAFDVDELYLLQCRPITTAGFARDSGNV